MRWKQGRRSTNVDDRRGRRVSRGAKVGGGAAILALLAALLFGQDPTAVLEQLSGGSSDVSVQEQSGPRPDDEAADFSTVILADTEDAWNAIFAAEGVRYQPPTLVLYDQAVQSACGFNSASTGPFYCPGDQQVYLDLSFLRELQRLGAPGDFAFAYVIAHEVGHHVQNLLGIERQVRQQQARSSRTQANELSVRMELQADCFAGVWANKSRGQGNVQLETGDVEEGLRAAAAIGDDRLQKMAGQRVQREAFTHGSSEQRVQWFRTGLERGDPDACDTFGR